MSTLTLQLPDTLYSQLVTLAQQERVQLKQYILYVLTHQVVSAYTTREIPSDDVERQRMAFEELRQRLGSASESDVADALTQRDAVEPEPDLQHGAVRRLRERIQHDSKSSRSMAR